MTELASDDCPWPDSVNSDVERAGVENCLPQKVAWTASELVRVVTGPLVGSCGAGWASFSRETKEAFKQTLGVDGSTSHTKHTATADSHAIGSIRAHQHGWSRPGGRSCDSAVAPASP